MISTFIPPLLAIALFWLLPPAVILCSTYLGFKARLVWSMASFMSLLLILSLLGIMALVWPDYFMARGSGEAYGFIVMGGLAVSAPWLVYVVYKW